ncbi:hypothetical protein PQ610_02350 [Tardisphaera miroshnichenkoae]
MMEFLALGEVTPEELEALVVKLKSFELVVLFDNGYKRVFLNGQASISLPLASLVETREKQLPPVSATVGLSLPYPIPLFDLGDGRRNALREALMRCAPAFDGMGLKLRVTEASDGDQLRAREFCERYWRKGIFFNGWKKSYEAYVEMAREKANQMLFRTFIKTIGDKAFAKDMLSCVSSGLHNKLVINGKSAVLCVSEVAELLRPQPRACSICTSKVLKTASFPEAGGRLTRAT